MRKKLLGITAALVAPAAFVLAPGAGADPNPAELPGAPAVDAAPAADAALVLHAVHAPEAVPGPPPEVVPVLEVAPAPEGAPVPEAAPAPEAAVVVPAAHIDLNPRLLPPGVGSEHGLQIETIRVERNVCAKFPEIRNVIGVRPDAKPWHPSGRAVDIMIPNPGSEAGIALGNEIRDYVLENAEEFGVQDVIWRGTYYTPSGPSGGNYGHFDHVHITTFGGGYPTGGEEYLSED